MPTKTIYNEIKFKYIYKWKKINSELNKFDFTWDLLAQICVFANEFFRNLKQNQIVLDTVPHFKVSFSYWS